MVEVETVENGQAGATIDVKGKIVEHLWELKKQGYKDSTINLRRQLLSILTRLGANLRDPESIKEAIAKL